MVKLIGFHEELEKCVASSEWEYMQIGKPLLSSLERYNLCILEALEVGRSYLARALGIKACNDYSVRYFHSEELIESIVALKQQDYGKFAGRMKQLIKMNLVIRDDFLLHSRTDEKEVKIFGEVQ